MSNLRVALIGVALIAVPGLAAADEAKGPITAVLPDNKAIVLDGHTYAFPATLEMTGLAPGDVVTIVYTVEPAEPGIDALDGKKRIVSKLSK